MIFKVFKKVFKGVGKVFKGIGKGIKKGFKAFGKAMNKLGIIGQIGMMFIAPHIGALAMKGLTALGSGFMTGLSNMGTLGKFAHGVISNAAKVAKIGIQGVRSITDTIGGVIADSTRQVASKLTGGYIKPLEYAGTKGTFKSESWYGKILENAQVRGNKGFQKTMQLARDAKKQFVASLPGGPEYAPRYEKFTDPKAKFLKTRSREIAYDSTNKSLFEASPEFKKRQQLLGIVPEDSISYEQSPVSETILEQQKEQDYLQPSKKSVDMGERSLRPDLTSLEIDNDSILARTTAGIKSQFTPENMGKQLSSVAQGQLLNLGMEQFTKGEEPLKAGAPPARTKFGEIFASTIGSVGSGQGLGQFGSPEDISDSQIDMNNFLGISDTSDYWDSMTNTARMKMEDQGLRSGQFISSLLA